MAYLLQKQLTTPQYSVYAKYYAKSFIRWPHESIISTALFIVLSTLPMPHQIRSIRP